LTKLLGDSLSTTFIKEVEKCKKSITIISPYITMDAVKQLIKKLPTNLNFKIVTQPPGIDYIIGSVEIDALQVLENKGFSLLYLHNLHAKI
jgi:hypothetical protein